MEIGIEHYLTVAAMLFTLGVFGIFLNRKNVIIILLSVELILLSVNINLVAFSSYMGDLVGQVFTMLILTVAAAEASIGLAILVVYFRFGLGSNPEHVIPLHRIFACGITHSEGFMVNGHSVSCDINNGAANFFIINIALHYPINSA